jgi:tetratricopeptide (TPR) repeat protein
MYQYVRTSTFPAGFAFLLSLISIAAPVDASLREEAASYRSRGYEAQRRGDRGEALADYQKAAALDPTYPTPHNDMGVLLEEQGRLEDAERAYLQALALNEQYLEPHANLAMLYERMGQREKAIYHWMKRYQLGDPYDPWTARAEERLLALGVLRSHPGLKGVLYGRRRLLDDEFGAQAKSREEFRTITETHGDWP